MASARREYVVVSCRGKGGLVDVELDDDGAVARLTFDEAVESGAAHTLGDDHLVEALARRDGSRFAAPAGAVEALYGLDLGAVQ